MRTSSHWQATSALLISQSKSYMSEQQEMTWRAIQAVESYVLLLSCTYPQSYGHAAGTESTMMQLRCYLLHSLQFMHRALGFYHSVGCPASCWGW